VHPAKSGKTGDCGLSETVLAMRDRSDVEAVVWKSRMVKIGVEVAEQQHGWGKIIPEK
jgi:hypothetical protein